MSGKHVPQITKRSAGAPRNSSSNSTGNNHRSTNASETQAHNRSSTQPPKAGGAQLQPQSTKPKSTAPLAHPPPRAEKEYERDIRLVLAQFNGSKELYEALIGNTKPSADELDFWIQNQHHRIGRAERRMQGNINQNTVREHRSRKDELRNLEKKRNMLYVPTGYHEHHTVSEGTGEKRHERRLILLHGLKEVLNQEKKPLKELNDIFTSSVEYRLNDIANEEFALSEPTYNGLLLLFHQHSDKLYYNTLVFRA